MTKPISRKTQRVTARAVIGTFVASLALLLVFQGSSFGQFVGAAMQSSTPTGSPSSSSSGSQSSSPTPTPTDVGPAIQWLNPSGHSNTISAKDDGQDTTYHLSAWVREVPLNPTVEFKYQATGQNEVTIGSATRAGTSNAWELSWAVQGIADGNYTLKAILYSNGVEIARDEEAVDVNNADTNIPPPPDPQAETVEITYPENGGAFGLYDVPVGTTETSGVIDFTASGANAEPSTSTGTLTVLLYYTTVAPGNEPEWIECGSEDPIAGEGAKGRCTLEAGVLPSAVTAVAAVASPELAIPTTTFQSSGDAHQVTSYQQVPSSITLDPTTQSSKASGTCSEVITATLRDQNSREISSARMDVHASGPSDNLQFDDSDSSGNQSSASQAPDKSHSNNELARNCEGTGNAGAQGQHEKAPPTSDIKHLESGPAGTNISGQFLFLLYSPEQGEADFGIWADEDDDDQWCVEEESALGSVTWNATASPSPSPSGSSSPSSSPSSSSSATPTPTPTPTQPGGSVGPETATCPLPTATPTGSPTGGEDERIVTLDVSKNKVRSGANVTFVGQISANDESCEDGEIVAIDARKHGTQTFVEKATTTTENDGSYSTVVKVKASADYRARVDASGGCPEATSEPETVLTKVNIALRVSDTTPEIGVRVVFKGKVSPNHRGTKVLLQRRKGQKWVKVATEQLNRRSRYRIAVATDWGRKSRLFRVVWKVQDDDHRKGTSKKARITPHV